MEKEALFKNRIQDLAALAYQRGIVTFTDFMDLNELHMLNSMNLKDAGVTCRLSGGYKMSERQIAAFLPDALSYDWDYPICCIKIKPLAAKFADALNHRDFLGALLNLGIERSVLGDILIKENCAYLFCLERMSEFIMENCTRVRHTMVLTQRIDSFAETITPDYESIIGSVASVRLDAMIGLAFSTSRSSMIGLIEGGKVFVNGRMITSNGYTLKPDDIISVRGYGKFQYSGVLSQTQKGRLRIQLSKYV